MAKKRKLASRSSQLVEPPKQQQQYYVEDVGQSDEEVEDQAISEDGDSESVYEEVEEEEEEEDDSDDDEYEDYDEPIQKLLEPFSKEKLIDILLEAANNHSDVADRIREIADEDTAHRKIFVHGLAWDSTAETLVNAFSQYGEMENFKLVSDKISGNSKGYGFIVFKTRRAAQEALKQPHKKIGGRMTACQLASIGSVPAPGTSAAAVQVKPVSEYTKKKIYVSNVGAELDPQKLFTFFSMYGEIEEGPLGLDKVTGKPKGFCLFVYKTVASAKKALEEPHKNFQGHVLHCREAIDGLKSGKSQHHHLKTHFKKNQNSNLIEVTGPGHQMPPSVAAATEIPFNQGAAASQALNPAALGQALVALFAPQGAGLALTNLLGTLGAAAMGAAGNQPVPGATHGGYGNQRTGSNVSHGMMGGFGNQGGLDGALQTLFPNQQRGHGNAGSSQHAAGNMGYITPQGAGLALTNLLGTLSNAAMGAGVNHAAPGATYGVYGNQISGSNVSPGMMGGYGNQGGLDSALQTLFASQQRGHGNAGSSQHGAGHMGGIAPFMGQ